MKTFTLANIALLVAGFLGGLTPVATKVVMRELEPATVLFWRLSIMLLVYFLLSVRHLDLLRRNIKAVLPVFLAWAGNIFFFTLGIKHTTVLVSQLIYLLIPIIVLIEAALFLKEKVFWFQVVGTILGIVGALQVLVEPGKIFSLGSLGGNGLILLAVLCWSGYIILSKHKKVKIPGAVGLFLGVSLAWLGVVGLMAIEGTTSSIFSIATLSLTGFLALSWVGLVSGYLMFFLFEWGISRGSAIVAGSTIYLGMVSSTLGGTMILGESFTSRMIFGAVLLIIGVFLTTTIPLLNKK